MAEDALYSHSTQFTAWQFPPSKLAAIRRQTNERGIRSIRKQWKKAREEAAAALALADGNGGEAAADGGGTTPEQVEDPEPLNVDEEAALVTYYCEKMIELTNHFEYSSNAKATAVTFLRRFHLHHSPLIYHPKHYLATILFLSLKCEGEYRPLSEFCKRSPLPVTEEGVLKHEFLIAGGLQWDLDVRHPLRACEGAIMELLTLINSDAPASMHGGGASWENRLGKTKREAADRVKEAQPRVRANLTTCALLSDSYFLYTPPQIFLGALYKVDKQLAEFYIEWKFGSSSANNRSKVANGDGLPKLNVDKLMETVKGCAGLLSAAEGSKTAPEEIRRIDKKLYMCQNPQKYIKGHPGKTGGGAAGGGGAGSKAPTPAINAGGLSQDGEETQQQKKRRLEREKAAREGDVFGGPTVKDSGGGSGSALFGAMLAKKAGET